MARTPGGLLRCDLTWSTENGGEIAVNALHFLYSQAWGDTAGVDDVQTQADATRDLVVNAVGTLFANVLTHVASSANLSGINVYALSTVTGRAIAKSSHGYAPSDNPGRGTGGALPPSLSATVGLWAYPPGGWVPDARRYRGKLFMPQLPMAALDTSTGMISNTHMDGIRDGWQGFLSELAGGQVGTGTIQPVVYSRLDSAARPIVAVTCSRVPAMQRRRVNALQFNHNAGVTVS